MDTNYSIPPVHATVSGGVQYDYLRNAINDGRTVTLFLMNGFQMRVRILASDAYSILVSQENGTQSLVYKHAISTVQ